MRDIKIFYFICELGYCPYDDYEEWPAEVQDCAHCPYCVPFVGSDNDLVDLLSDPDFKY